MAKSNIPEFSIGDKVTFKPYETEIPAKIVRIVPNSEIQFNFNLDDRIFYELTGTDTKKPLTSITTGKSIKESKLFKNELSKLKYLYTDNGFCRIVYKDPITNKQYCLQGIRNDIDFLVFETEPSYSINPERFLFEHPKPDFYGNFTSTDKDIINWLESNNKLIK